MARTKQNKGKGKKQPKTPANQKSSTPTTRPGKKSPVSEYKSPAAHKKGGKGRIRLPKGIDEITKGGIRRLARRGGVKRVSNSIYEEVRQSMKKFVEHTLEDAVILTKHAKTKTITAGNVVYSLKKNGVNLYGFHKQNTTELYPSGAAHHPTLLEQRCRR